MNISWALSVLIIVPLWIVLCCLYYETERWFTGKPEGSTKTDPSTSIPQLISPSPFMEALGHWSSLRTSSPPPELVRSLEGVQSLVHQWMTEECSWLRDCLGREKDVWSGSTPMLLVEQPELVLDDDLNRWVLRLPSLEVIATPKNTPTNK